MGNRWSRKQTWKKDQSIKAFHSRKQSAYYLIKKQKLLEDVANSQVSQDFISEMREAFFMFDKDNSGFICSKEMGHLLRTMGYNPTEAEVNNLIAEVDVDHNGKVCLTFFLTKFH